MNRAVRGSRSGGVPNSGAGAWRLVFGVPAGVILLAAACAPPPRAAPVDPASVRVVLDGSLEEWDAVPTLVEDRTGGADDTGLGLRSLKAWDDPAWLYLALETEEVLNLQALPGTIRLLLDVDGQPGTGVTVDGFAGAELVLDMSVRRPGVEGEYGAGFGLRVVPASDGGREGDGAVGGLEPRNPYDVAITALPTHAADRFELRLRRDARERLPGLPVLEGTLRIGAVAVAPDSSGTVVDALPATPYRLRTAPGADPFQPTLSPLRSPPEGSFRVAAWNVSEGQFRTPGDHARLLAAVRPDVILLDEAYEEVDDGALAAFFARPALAALGDWSWAISRGGGRQKTVVAARNRALRPEPALRTVAYAPGALEALRRQVDTAFHRALETEARSNLSATGAWVEVGPGAEALFVPVDFQSAGYDGSAHDVLRLLQAGTVKRVVRAATAGRSSPPPVVIAGDLNLVGSRAPLDVLLADRRDPYGPLAVAALPRIDEATWATWRSPRQALFGPGRLDFTLFSSETLEQVGGFVFGVDGLTDAQLDELGLERELAGTVSDHQIMVTDLRLKTR